MSARFSTPGSPICWGCRGAGCSASPTSRQFRPRAAYRYTVEDSIYVAPDAVGQGVGLALLSALIEACEALGKRQMIAVIGDSGNAASIGLHAALGFIRAGVGHDVGFKHGRWVDIVWMQRTLNGGGSSAPSDR